METQAELIPVELLPDDFRVPEDPTGRSTGERVKRDRPALYEAVIRAGAEGMGIRQTARALKIHRDTVAAIFECEENRIGTLKQLTVRNLRRFAAIASERALEEVEKMHGVQLMIAQGIAIEKANLLEGQATSITEQRGTAKRIGSLDDLIDELRSVTPIGPGAEAGAQKELPAPVQALEVANSDLKRANIDSASTGGNA